MLNLTVFNCAKSLSKSCCTALSTALNRKGQLEPLGKNKPAPQKQLSNVFGHPLPKPVRGHRAAQQKRQNAFLLGSALLTAAHYEAAAERQLGTSAASGFLVLHRGMKVFCVQMQKSRSLTKTVLTFIKNKNINKNPHKQQRTRSSFTDSRRTELIDGRSEENHILPRAGNYFAITPHRQNKVYTGCYPAQTLCVPYGRLSGHGLPPPPHTSLPALTDVGATPRPQDGRKQSRKRGARHRRRSGRASPAAGQ